MPSDIRNRVVDVRGMLFMPLHGLELPLRKDMLICIRCGDMFCPDKVRTVVIEFVIRDRERQDITKHLRQCIRCPCDFLSHKGCIPLELRFRFFEMVLPELRFGKAVVLVVATILIEQDIG